MTIVDRIVAMARGTPAGQPSTTLSPQTTAPSIEAGEAGEVERGAVLAEIEKLFAPRIGPGGSREVTLPPGVPVQTMQELFRQAPASVRITAEERTALRKLESEIASLRGRLESFGRDRIHTALDARQREVAEKLARGESFDVAPTRKRLTEEFEGNRAALKNAIREKISAAAKLVSGVAARLVPFARKAADDLLVEEFSKAGRFGVRFEPSLLVKVLVAAKTRLEDMEHGNVAGGTPRLMAECLGIIEL